MKYETYQQAKSNCLSCERVVKMSYLPFESIFDDTVKPVDCYVIVLKTKGKR